MAGCGHSTDAGVVASKAAAVSTLATTFPVVVDASPDAVLGGAEWVDIGNSVRIGSGPYGSVMNTGTGLVTIGTDSRVGSVWSAGGVELRDRAQVDGDVHATMGITRFEQTSITGNPLNTGIGATMPITFEASELGTPRGDRRLEPNQVQSLDPGAYGYLEFKQDSVVRLKTGRYLFSDIMGNSGGRIEIDSLCGPVEIFVTNSLYWRLSLMETSGHEGRGMAIVYSGASSAHIESSYRGTIIAPNAELILDSSTHEGRFFAKRLRVQSNATILPGRNALSVGEFCTGSESNAVASWPETGCVDSLCCPEDGALGAVTKCNGSTVASCVAGGGDGEVFDARESGRTPSGHFMAFGRGGDDLIVSEGALGAVSGGDGNDVLCGGGGDGSWLVGGTGDDWIRTTSGKNVILPGNGKDTLLLGPGDDIVIVASLCEIVPGEVWRDSGGRNVVKGALTRSQLEAAGLVLEGDFEFELTPALDCHASCGGHAGCALQSPCVSNPSGGEVCPPPHMGADIALSAWDSAYWEAPGELRTLLIEYGELVAAGPSAETERRAKLTSLRARRNELRPVIWAEYGREEFQRVFEWRAFQIELLGDLGGSASVPLLESVAKSPHLPTSEDDEDHHQSTGSLESRIRATAVSGLVEMARAGVTSATDSLERILAAEDRGGHVEAVLYFRGISDTESVRNSLRAKLPESSRHLADATLYNIASSSGPVPPSSIRSVP